MGETIYTFFLTLSPIVGAGIPLMMVIPASTVLVFARASTASERNAMRRLRMTGCFCAVVWLFFYAEIWSPTRMPVFDYGAPLMALLALMVLPILALSVWSHHRVFLKNVGLKRLFILANILIVLSLAPGIFLVLFFAAAMTSSR